MAQEPASPPEEDEPKETGKETADAPSPDHGHRRLWEVSVPFIVLGVIGLLAGTLLLLACTPTTSSSPCTGNETCLPSGNCPFAADGVLVLSGALVVLVLGIVGYWGRRPEGSAPHPERPPERPPPETAMTRMEKEREERRRAAEERKD